MLDAEEHDELRSLQARAYGRDASLTASEAARLRELEDRRVTRADDTAGGDPAEITEAVPAQPAPVAPRVLFGQEDAGATSEADDGSGEAAVGGGPAAAAPSLLSLLRRHWRPAAITAVAVLLIGLGVGWLAFGRSGAAPVELTATQRSWQDDLVSGGVYDSGSIRALGVEEGAVIWAATKERGASICLILRAGDVAVPNCGPSERVSDTGIYGSIMVAAEGDLHRQINVQMLLTAAGQPAVAVSTYDYDPGTTGFTYASEGESQTATRLVEEGFDPNALWVIGYDGDVPIWSGTQIESQNRCLIHDGSRADSPMVCVDPETMQDQDSSLILTVVDAETGDVTNLELASNNGPEYLVITREGGVSGAGEG